MPTSGSSRRVVPPCCDDAVNKGIPRAAEAGLSSDILIGWRKFQMTARAPRDLGPTVGGVSRVRSRVEIGEKEKNPPKGEDLDDSLKKEA